MYNGFMAVMNIIQRTINTHVTPLGYLFAVWQTVFGVNHLLLDDKGGARTVLSEIDPLMPTEIWGLILVVASVSLIIGMLCEKISVVQVSAFAGFALWVMAMLSYVLNGFIWLHAPSAALQAMMFGYFFLAAGINQLWDYAPERY